MCLSIAVKYPDRVLGRGVHLGHEWIVTHNNMGYRCGYVKVEPGHPWHGKDYSDIDAECHGGLTFAGADEPCDKGGPDNGWWLGFDCAHDGDGPDPELPGGRALAEFYGDYNYIPRSQLYAENECQRLCRQAAVALDRELCELNAEAICDPEIPPPERIR